MDFLKIKNAFRIIGMLSVRMLACSYSEMFSIYFRSWLYYFLLIIEYQLIGLKISETQI